MKKAIAPKVATGMERCGWQGYGFGASYEDAGCVNGKASDLDNCEHTASGVLIAIGDEDCPNCHGKGVVISGLPTVGPMALIRQRERLELCEEIMQLADCGPGDPIKEYCQESCKKVEALFGLIQKLEDRTRGVSGH